MYLEGFLVSLLAVNFLMTSSKWVKGLILLIWPLSVPFLLYGLYNKYKGLLQNPMLGALMGLGTNPFESSDNELGAHSGSCGSSQLPFEFKIPEFPQSLPACDEVEDCEESRNCEESRHCEESHNSIINPECQFTHSEEQIKETQGNN